MRGNRKIAALLAVLMIVSLFQTDVAAMEQASDLLEETILLEEEAETPEEDSSDLFEEIVEPEEPEVPGDEPEDPDEENNETEELEEPENEDAEILEDETDDERLDSQQSEDAFYHGQEADYEDPQFLKLLEDGFFEEESQLYAWGEKHDDRFQGCNVLKGIDVSRWNGIIDWTKVAEETDFVFIRCGNRTTSGGELKTDPMFAVNMKGALDAGLKVGVYIYSQAITTEEARAEAVYAMNLCKGYQFTLPIVIDYEYYSSGRLRDAKLTRQNRTDICRTFCEEVEKAGYPAMIYANKSMLVDDMYADQLTDAGYHVWLAQWIAASNYTGAYTFWQYSDAGSVNGMVGRVDMNYQYELQNAAITGLSNTASGVQVKWNSIKGATGYSIYRRTQGEKLWRRVGAVTGENACQYLDTSAADGTTYAYAIQTVKGSVISLFDRSGAQQIRYLKGAFVTNARVNARGVQITWNTYKTFDHYTIYRRKDGVAAWSPIAREIDGNARTYVDCTSGLLNTGERYFYTIAGYAGDTKMVSDTLGVPVVTKVDAPKTLTVANDQNGLLLKWDQVPFAVKYRIYRKTDDSAWSLLTDVTGLSYEDTSVSHGVNYYYSVQTISEGSYSTRDMTGTKCLCLETPSIDSCENTPDGIRLRWTSGEKMDRYRLYRRKNGSGSWVFCADLSGDQSSYVDASVESDTVYAYTLRGVVGNVWSGYHRTGWMLKRLNAPTAITASHYNGGCLLRWQPVKGAERYRIYQKIDGKWKQLQNTTETSCQIPLNVADGTLLQYTVSAVSDEDKQVTANMTGVSYRMLKQPKITSISCTPNGLLLKWAESSEAAVIRIYRREPGQSWAGLVDLSCGGQYLDETAAVGKVYQYTLRFRNANGLTGYDAGVSSIRLDTPDLISAVPDLNGVVVSWEKTTGAEKYYVYRKTAVSGWTRIGITDQLTYQDQTAQNQEYYIYTIRAVCGGYLSNYDTKGVSCRAYSAPRISRMVNAAAGINVYWNQYAGAEQYFLYRRQGTSGWRRIYTGTRLGYTDTQVVNGVKYQYTLRVRIGGTLSGYHANEWSCFRVGLVTGISAKGGRTGTVVSWNPVNGADGYDIWRRMGNGAWRKIGHTVNCSYSDPTITVENSAGITYTIRACKGNIVGPYDSKGVMVS